MGGVEVKIALLPHSDHQFNIRTTKNISTRLVKPNSAHKTNIHHSNTINITNRYITFGLMAQQTVQLTHQQTVERPPQDINHTQPISTKWAATVTIQDSEATFKTRKIIISTSLLPLCQHAPILICG